VRSCETSFGMVDCRSLSEFLGDINAEVVLECDPESASEGVISCNSSFTSDIHRALGSEASSVPVSVEYRGGKAQAISVVLSFAADPTLHEEFMGFATTVDGLIRENGRPIWNADSGGDWVAAAEAFANR
jgi:indole-3-glycerol phosphate synthase